MRSSQAARAMIEPPLCLTEGGAITLSQEHKPGNYDVQNCSKQSQMCERLAFFLLDWKKKRISPFTEHLYPKTMPAL